MLVEVLVVEAVVAKSEKGSSIVITFGPGRVVNVEHGGASQPDENWGSSVGVEFPFGFAPDN